MPVLLLLAALLVFGMVADASAWSNGRNGPNSFGTHDWILREGADSPAGRVGGCA
jgi:hypothetical protein